MAKAFRIGMIPGSTDGVNYYRLAQWAFEMRKYRNVTVDLLWFGYQVANTTHPWQRDFKSSAPSGDIAGLSIGQYIRYTIERVCEKADVVVWHPVFYDYLMDFFLEMRHKYQKPFVVETDDNFFDVPVWNEAGRSFANGMSYRTIAQYNLQNTDGIVCSTPHLASLYSSFCENISIVENSLDFKGDSKFVGWNKVSPRKHKGVRLGWIGGRSHFEDLMMIAPVLREVLASRPNVSLTLVNSALKQSCELTGKPYPFEGLKNVLIADRSVSINRYAPFTASFGFDIGIAPLVDHNFNRSKSNLRWLEYSALGIPSVCSNIGHFAKTVKNGQDGLLASNLDEWKQHLLALIDLPAFRENVGRNAAKRVRRDFNVRRNAPKYLRILKDIAGQDTVVDEAPEKEMVPA